MNVKIRLHDGRAVDALYHSPSSAVRGFHNVVHNGELYVATCFKPDEVYGQVRFIGPGAVMRDAK